MPVRVSKDFRFEAAHRLPWYDGPCANLHGHSYHVTVSMEGEPDARGMVADFRDIKDVVRPLIDAWDHSVLIAEGDEALLEAVRALGSRFVVLPVDTTAENMALLIAEHVLTDGTDFLRARGITRIGVAVRETATSEAYVEREVTHEPTRHVA